MLKYFNTVILTLKLKAMNQTILNELTTGLIDGWYSDLQYLVDTIEKYKLNVDSILDQVEDCFWGIQPIKINYLIYIALTTVAQSFIEQNKELFEECSDDYFIHTNYLDSSIYFEDEKVQEAFEKFF